jgi:hypothetical protein
MLVRFRPFPFEIQKMLPFFLFIRLFFTLLDIKQAQCTHRDARTALNSEHPQQRAGDYAGHKLSTVTVTWFCHLRVRT